MSIEQTTTPDPPPAACGCEPDTQVSTGSTCNPCIQRIVNEQVEQYIRAEALSGLLRGMARRVGKHRVAFATLRQHMIRAGGKIERERDEARVELARVRPVVDAAREVAESWDRGEWRTGPRGTEVMHKLAYTVETADILADPDTVAAIAEGAATSTDEMRWSPADGDAAATPQPAAPSLPENPMEPWRCDRCTCVIPMTWADTGQVDPRCVVHGTARAAGGSAPVDDALFVAVSNLCNDVNGPHGGGAPCALPDGHERHRDGIEGEWPIASAPPVDVTAEIAWHVTQLRRDGAAPVAGSAHYDEGWRNAYEQAANDMEARAEQRALATPTTEES